MNARAESCAAICTNNIPTACCCSYVTVYNKYNVDLTPQITQDPKYRSLSTSSKVYQEVLAPHPPMLEALRLAGFRHKDGDETHLTLLHR